MRKFLFAVPFCLLCFLSCQRRSEPVEEGRRGVACGKAVQVNATDYDKATSDPFVIKDATISGDCLSVTRTGSGCSGSSWQAELQHQYSYYTVFPPRASSG